MTFNKKKLLFFILGQVKMSFGQVFFIKFVLYLPELASGNKNLCSTLSHIVKLWCFDDDYLSIFM